MTTQTRNEAAERLREAADDAGWLRLEDALSILAAERRATVERIRERYIAARDMPDAPPDEPIDVLAILDEELRTADAKAAR